MTFAVAADRWWREHGSDLRDSNLKTAIDWLTAQVGDTLLHHVDDDLVSSLVERRKRDVVRAGRDDRGVQLYRPVAAQTINNTVPALMRRILRRARDNWNAILMWEPHWKRHFAKRIKTPIREITSEEEQRLDAVEDPDFADLRRFAISTGVRRRGLLLTWPQVDFAAGVFRIQKKGGEWQTIPMTTEIYAMLWARRGQHPVQVWTFVARRTRHCPHHKTLQIKGERYPITYHGLASRKQRSWAAAGVDARIHDLRHTSGTRTLRKTGNIKIVQQLLGHKDIKTTAEFYADVTQDDLRAAMEATADRPAQEASQGEKHANDR